ncbi:MAG: hypothetical protein ACKO14_14790 [Armatimonadota bacterium]
MLGRFGLFTAIFLMTMGAVRAEETVWVSTSTPHVKVSKSGTSWKFETAKATWYVKQGERLPAHLQTEAGKVLRAGIKPTGKGNKR